MGSEDGPHDVIQVVLARLDRIESKLDRVLNGPVSEIVNLAGAMVLTGCRTKRAQSLWFKRYGITPYERGKYRRVQITNKIAELALFRKAPKPS